MKKINIFEYLLYWENVLILWHCFQNAFKISLFGCPRVSGANMTEIARNIMRNNFAEGKLLYAGPADYRGYMWVSDFAMAIKGAETVLEKEQISRALEYMIEESVRFGQVPTTFNSTRGLDLPAPRGDSLPMLLYSVWEYARWSKDVAFLDKHRKKLQFLLTEYEKDSFGSDGLISRKIIFDWEDTVYRPSSTWDNIWALETAKIAFKMGLQFKFSATSLEKKILAERFRKNYFFDHAQTESLSIDSALLAAYLGLFSVEIRRSCLRKLEEDGYLEPYPMRASAYIHPRKYLPPLVGLTVGDYHEKVIWPHLGFMYLNGLKNLGEDYKTILARMEPLIMKFHNFPEVLRPDGKDIYRNFFHFCELGMTMAVGQYLELVASPDKN